MRTWLWTRSASGSSLSQIQKKLAYSGLSATRYTILCYVKIASPWRVSMPRRKISRRSAEKQAAHFVRLGLALGKPRHKARKDGLIHSLGTARAYQQALTLLGRWIQGQRRGDLRSADVNLVQEYLNERQSQVGQKTLDRDRQAAQFLLRIFGTNTKLQRVFSTFSGERKLAKQSRGYTPEQVDAIASRQSARTGLATRIAYAAGLRAHELLTIRPKSEQPRAPTAYGQTNDFREEAVKPTRSLVRVDWSEKSGCLANWPKSLKELVSVNRELSSTGASNIVSTTTSPVVSISPLYLAKPAKKCSAGRREHTAEARLCTGPNVGTARSWFCPGGKDGCDQPGTRTFPTRHCD